MKIKLFNNLNRVLSSNDRVSSVDIWRGLAIISVVLYHFNGTLSYGSLGVDLFFVISGLLVGGLLTKPFLKEEKISFFNFFLRRGFKIWPSYYTFLVLGTIIATLTYNSQNSNQIIPFTDFKRYLLFYQNYTGFPFHGVLIMYGHFV
jgi:peptidoglycan/LPS O-acetylase OafA/YrhL